MKLFEGGGGGRFYEKRTILPINSDGHVTKARAERRGRELLYP